MNRPVRTGLAAALVTCGLVCPAGARGQEAANNVPCSVGSIGSVEVDNGSVYDLSETNSGVVRWAFRVLNAMHIRTRESFIRKELLFAEGDCFDPFALGESERLLEASPTLRSVRILSEDRGDGAHDVRVVTWDAWSTRLEGSVTYDEGINLERLLIGEKNFLGRGMFAQFRQARRREVFDRSLGFSTPRLFGRANAGFTIGRRRAGDFAVAKVNYPFVGDRGRISVFTNIETGPEFFSWTTGDAEAFSNVLVPMDIERAELSGATRFGSPGNQLILGLGLTRDRIDFGEEAELVLGSDFDEPVLDAIPSQVLHQLQPFAATRVALHLGLQRYHEFRRYRGLDAFEEERTLPLGLLAGFSVGHSLGPLAPEGDFTGGGPFGRVFLSARAPVGQGVVQARLTAEGRRSEGWRDVLGEADLVGYLRLTGLPSHLLFLRASAAWTESPVLPVQLTLGGRYGIRSLRDNDFPGGRTVRFTVEDRISPEWLRLDALRVGLTLLADVGRMWPGDVPYGVDSGWRAGVGGGIRFSLPASSRNATRLDWVFPVDGHGGDPVFRITVEVNRVMGLFGTPTLRRSFRVPRGIESF